MALVGTETISGVEVEVHASKSGMWELRPPGEGHTQYLAYGDTLDKVKAQARKALAKGKTKVSVTFITQAGEHGVATGIHSSSRNIMARIDGKSFQLSGYNETRVLSPAIPDETLERYLQLGREIRTRENEARQIQKEWELDLRGAVSRAIEEAVSSAEAARSNR